MNKILVIIVVLVRITWTLDESKCYVGLENAENQKALCPGTSPDMVKYLYFKYKLTTVKIETFANFPNLVKIYLNGTEVGVVEDGAFNGVRVLEELYLNNNSISELKDPFGDLENLVILDLSRNGLLKLDPQVFRNLQKIKKLSLNRNKLTNLNLRFGKQLRGNRVSIDCSYNELTTVRIDSMWDITQIAPFSGILESLNLSWNKIASLTPNSLSIGRYSENLNLSYNSISQIDDTFFKNFDELKRLDLSNNKLTNLNVKMFTDLSNLEELSLNENYLDIIPSSSFDSLLKLKILHVSGNKLKSINFNLFSKLNVLRVLDLSNNDINSVSDFNFKSLEVLDLSRNHISDVGNLDISDMKNIKKIILHHNELKKIRMTAPYYFYRSLDLLDISFNKATGIETPDIKSLNVSNNQYSSTIRFGDKFVDVSNNRVTKFSITSEETEFVNASYNQIGNLEASDFTVAINLKELHLSNNLLSQIDRDAFFYTKKLKILNLSYNRLNDLQGGTFDELTELEVLDVSSNNFVYLYTLEPPNLNRFRFNRFGHLRILWANNNPWSCSVFKNLKHGLQKPLCTYYPIDAKDFDSMMTLPPQLLFTTEMTKIFRTKFTTPPPTHPQFISHVPHHTFDRTPDFGYLETHLANIDKLAKIISYNEKVQNSMKDLENRLNGLNSSERFYNNTLAKYNSIDDKLNKINNRLTKIIDFQNAYNNLETVDKSNDFLTLIVIVSVILVLLLINIFLLLKLITNNKSNHVELTNY